MAWQLRFSRLVPLNVLLAFINDTALAALSPVDDDKMPVFMAATSKSAVRVSQLHPQLVLRWRHSSGGGDDEGGLSERIEIASFDCQGCTALQREIGTVKSEKDKFLHVKGL